MSRLSRKEIKHDKFVHEIGHAYDVARRNTMKIVAVVTGVALLIGVIIGTVAWRRSQEGKAQVLLSEAMEAIEAPVGPDAAAMTAGPTFDTEEARDAKALELFTRVLEEYGSYDAADVARIYLGRMAAEKGDVETAKKHFEVFVDEHPQHLLAAGAQMSLIELRLSSEPVEQVASELEQKLDLTEETALPKDAILVLLARAWEMKGDEVKAREYYQRIVNEYPESVYSLEAQRKVVRG